MSDTKTPPAMTLNQLQASVHAWISQWEEGYFSPLSNLARLTEEVGELAREINHQHGDKPRKSTDVDRKIEEELADILFVVITLANSLDVDLEDAFGMVMKKYNLRDAGRFTPKQKDT